ncbi:hypothetical protein [Leptodesmis sichuanensis]|uniref:hypothetical protein n=1 Tax=Leptodesmis sichuanensis TaxID=2906798 RepID=UPI001F3ED050|nr:hypothetical protein [Leptodesmis sichuanensis]UIE38052.1 hypothetical protein KIK02_24660 [Leptodesmis sichuanensis A121]
MLYSCVALLLGITTLYWSRSIADEATRIVTGIVSRFSLFLSLVYAPWPIKMLIAIAILVFPFCTQRYNIRYGLCSHRCMIRASCPHVHA